MDAAQLFVRAARQLARKPRFTLSCIASLAFAVASATAALAVAARAFLDPLPYIAGDDLVTLHTATQTMEDAPVSVHVFEEMRADDGPLVDFIALRPAGVALLHDGATEQVPGVAVSGAFFDAIVRPAAGRAFQPGERSGVIISHALKQRIFGDADAIGRALTINGTATPISGVLPANFTIPYWATADALLPLDLESLLTEPRSRMQLTVLARIRSGADLAAVNAWLATHETRLRTEHEQTHGNQRWWARPLRDGLIGPVGPALRALLVAALLLLVTAGANIASLAAVHAVIAHRDLGVRRALGASRGRLLLERAAEAIIMAAAGTAAGVWLASLIVHGAATLQSAFLMRMAPISLDARTALVGAAAGLLTGAAAATLPHVPAILRNTSFTSTTRSTAGGRVVSLRSALVSVQVAVALVLLVGAGLLVRTVSNLAQTDLGFDAGRLMHVSVNMGARYDSPESQIAFEDQVLEQLAALPGVVHATASVGAAMTGGMRASLSLRDRPDVRGEIAYLSVAPGYMDRIGVPLVEGRDLSSADVPDGEGAMLVNETMARTYWPAGDAVGSLIYVGPGAPGDEWMRVVGVVRDFRAHGVVEGVLPTAFGSTRQYTWPRRTFTLRIADPVPMPSRDQLRRAVGAVDPHAPVGNIEMVNEIAANQTARHRLLMLTLGFFGAVAAGLAAFGLFAVISLASRMRRREYAIRMAVGAAPAGIRGLVLSHGLRLGLIGILGGAALAAAGTRLIASQLHGVAPLDPLTFLAAAGGLLAIATGAAWLPARAAVRVDPATTLRCD